MTEPTVGYFDAIAAIESALKLHEGEHALPRERSHYVGRALAAAGLLADPEQGSELAPGCRVFLRKHPEDQVFGTVMRPWRGAKGDRGWFVQWDGGDEEGELDEDLADAHLVECGRDWTRVTRAAGLIQDDTPDDVLAAIEKLAAERDQLQAQLDAVDAALDYPTHAGGLLDRVRAALAKRAQPDAPTEPAPRLGA